MGTLGTFDTLQCDKVRQHRDLVNRQKKSHSNATKRVGVGWFDEPQKRQDACARLPVIRETRERIPCVLIQNGRAKASITVDGIGAFNVAMRVGGSLRE